MGTRNYSTRKIYFFILFLNFFYFFLIFFFNFFLFLFFCFKSVRPETKFLIVGLKEDLRNDPDIIKNLEEKLKPVTFQEGENLCKKLNGYKYCENSAKTQKGIKETFTCAMEAVIEEKNSGGCIIC
jgi:hypothetical protein